MSGYLFRRLRKGNAQLWAERWRAKRPREVSRELPVKSLEGVRYAPTGGQRVPEEVVSELRRRLVEVAEARGYPDRRSNTGQRSFDLEAARVLVDLPLIRGEALRDEVWQYFTCLLAPDLVVWRHGKTKDGEVEGPTSQARFLGGTRNALQRLWWRGIIFRDRTAEDELWLLNSGRRGLTEDNFVALLERGNIAWYSDLCRSLATEFVRHRPYVAECGDSPEQTLLREVMKKVVRLAAHTNPEVIPEDDRLELVRALFVETVREMGGDAPAPGRVYGRFAIHLLSASDLPDSGEPEIHAREQIQRMLGEEAQCFESRWRWYWPDGALRTDDKSMVRWYESSTGDAGGTDWRLVYDPASGMEGAREGDFLVLADRVHGEELELFLLPQESRITLQVLGALGSRDGGVDASAVVERFVREALHARL